MTHIVRATADVNTCSLKNRHATFADHFPRASSYQVLSMAVADLFKEAKIAEQAERYEE